MLITLELTVTLIEVVTVEVADDVFNPTIEAMRLAKLTKPHLNSAVCEVVGITKKGTDDGNREAQH